MGVRSVDMYDCELAVKNNLGASNPVKDETNYGKLQL
jgi:hypothetical protein